MLAIKRTIDSLKNCQRILSINKAYIKIVVFIDNLKIFC